MDLHAQLLEVAGLLRGAAAAPEASDSLGSQQLQDIADRIDPSVYSPAATVDGFQEGIAAAVERLDAIPADIRPVTIRPMIAQLREVASIDWKA